MAELLLCQTKMEMDDLFMVSIRLLVNVLPCNCELLTCVLSIIGSDGFMAFKQRLAGTAFGLINQQIKLG
jgi:hypothetical protein